MTRAFGLAGEESGFDSIWMSMTERRRVCGMGDGRGGGCSDVRILAVDR
jgi:hypothetical protein